MKKIKILFIIAFAVVGALLIYNHFDKEKNKVIKPNPIQVDYNITNDDIVFVSKSIDEIINAVGSDYAIIFMCTPETVWCQKYANILNDVAIEKDIDKILYLNIRTERSMNTLKYQKLINLLSDILRVDDSGEKRIYMPEVLFIKNGRVIAHDNETSIVTSDTSVTEYYTLEKEEEIRERLRGYIDLLNSDDTNETNETVIEMKESEE